LKPRKSAREILTSLNLDPIKDLVEIARQSRTDYDRIVKATEAITNDLVRAEMMKVGNDSKKLHMQTLKELNSICAKEDDQGIKLLDHSLRREELEWKRAKAEKEDKTLVKDHKIVYMPANLEVRKLPDGREVMVDRDAENEG
jgi:hypothetical protein